MFHHEEKTEFIIGRSLLKKNQPPSPTVRKPIFELLQSLNKERTIRTITTTTHSNPSLNDTIDSDHLYQEENQYTPTQILPPSQSNLSNMIESLVKQC